MLLYSLVCVYTLSFIDSHTTSYTHVPQEDLPDLGDEGPVVTPRKQKSYSPRREEKERLLEEEVLPDTVNAQSRVCIV